MSTDQKKADGTLSQDVMSAHIVATLPQIEQQIAKLGQNALTHIGQKIKPRLPKKLQQEWSKLDNQHKKTIKKFARNAVNKIWKSVKAKAKKNKNKGTGRKKTTKPSSYRRYR
jgi:mRNA-degrading endonuclease RelE of RelBE toxin-antitoxin system